MFIYAQVYKIQVQIFKETVNKNEITIYNKNILTILYKLKNLCIFENSEKIWRKYATTNIYVDFNFVKKTNEYILLENAYTCFCQQNANSTKMMKVIMPSFIVKF